MFLNMDNNKDTENPCQDGHENENILDLPTEENWNCWNFD